ncbi:thioesterase [Colletotrichum karsti]|uniref:Thioesterase n=1 Tax=Colletotrichum karsti TaxID=1095194 RepID=A0A9P6I040_9PEZI|nr:thioesterase [Colletotrichum karsti]KAF9871536.1 thioesterase [Colletotrichum karsti]
MRSLSQAASLQRIAPEPNLRAPDHTVDGTMIPRTATRRLARELSSPRRALLRPLTTSRPSLLRAQQPPPPPPPPPGSIPQSQQAAASAALQNLSHLTPSQITALLTAAPGNPHQQHQQPPTKPPFLSPRVRRALWALLFFAIGYKLTDDQIASIRFFMPFLIDPEIFPNGPDEAEEAAYFRAAATAEVLQATPLLASMMPSATSTPDGRFKLRETSWEMWEPYADFPEHRKKSHLVAGSLNTPNAMGAVHVVFRHRLTGELVVAVVFGYGTTGWPGVVHGGMLSTVMDEAMGRLAALSFPANTAVTANLQMDFQVPVTPGLPYIVRVNKLVPELQKRGPDGEDKTDRKLYLHGRMEGPDGQLAVEATGLFVVPKGVEVQPLGKRF